MVLYNDDLYRKHNEICNKLNLEPKTITAAWESYTKISKNYILEGDPLYWLGCAVYIECRKAILPTLGKSVVEGNCISLSSLLRYCNLSLRHFFPNIKKWIIMAKVPDNLKNKITQLESKFSVSYSVFKVFGKLYGEVFKIPTPQGFIQEMENAKQHRSRKPRSGPCSPVKIFEFCWHLFVAIKSQDPTYSTDLVKSCELLIACLDLFFKNAYTNNQRELINPECKCEPVDWLNTDLDNHKDTLIDILSKHVAEAVNATFVITIRVYELPKMLKKVFDDVENQGNQDFTDLFDQTNFEANFKKVNNIYSAQLLKNGDLDERMLFAEHRRNACLLPGGDFDSAATDSPRPGGNLSDTPLTGRRYLGPKEYSVDARASLNTMLAGRKAEPSEVLMSVLGACVPNPVDKIKTIVSSLGDKFLEAMSDKSDARHKLELGTKMFYKFLESLLQNELSISKNITLLVQHDTFYEGVFTCCLEIVIHAYGTPQRWFPWILRALNIEAWNVLKVIELIIRSKDSQLGRFSIKHFNMVEENILDHIMWKADSQLWTAIANSGQPIPKHKDVALPGHLVYKPEKIEEQSPTNNNTASVIRNPLQSPGPSAADRFQSPINPSLSVSRQLFGTSQNGQAVTAKKTHLMITNKDGNQRLIPIINMDTKPQIHVQQQTQQASPTEGDVASSVATEPVSSKPKLGGSLAIIFRKFYNLAAVRLDHLCNKLGLTSNRELIHKIWTLFEESVISTDLMKERHLDQLLMCAVYVACVLSGHHIKFSEIMKNYRDQPQAKNFIYRSVLIKPKRLEEKDGSQVELPEERNDLIFFYNHVYIREMNKPIANLSRHVLSPLPALRKSMPSPSIEISKNVFVKPFDSPSTGSPKLKSYNYYFSRSPSKDLKDINKAINSNFVTGKRLLVDGNNDQSSKRLATSANRKVQSLIEERRSQNSE